MKKILKASIFLFFLCMSVGGSGLLADAAVLPASNNQSNLLKEGRLFNLEQSAIEKTQLWAANGFDLFLGNNVKNGLITEETNQIMITRNSPNYSKIYELSIMDMDWGRVYGSATIYRGITEANILLNSKLSVGKTYMVLVRELDPWGQLTGRNYPIGYFSTAQGPALALDKPRINEITDQDRTVTGTATPNTTVYLTIGVDKYRGTVSADGSFKINLDTTYTAGTGVEVYVVNDSGIKSDNALTIVKGANGMLGVNPIYSSDSTITGKTIPNVLVEASVDNNKERARIFEGTSDSQGYFTIDMRGRTYPAGTQITVTALKNDGTKLSKLVIVYPRTPSVNTINVNDTVITGSADPNATLEVLINNVDKYRTTVDTAGNFRVVVDPLRIGDKLSIYQESNGIKSEVVTLVVK